MRRRFSDDGMRVHTLACAEAHRLDHGWLGCEHLLLGLCANHETPVSLVLSNQAADLESVRREVSRRVAADTGPSTEHRGLKVTPRATVVLALANVEAERLGAQTVRSEHILLALLTEGESLAVLVLLALGVDVRQLYREVLSVLDVPAETQRRYLRERQITDT